MPFKSPSSIARPPLRKGRRKAAVEPYHHGNLKAALLAAGLKLLKDQGAEALGLRELARQAGVSRTAPYRHFDSKDALIAAIAEEGFVKLKSILDETRRVHEGDAEAWFVEGARQYIRFATTYAEHFKVMFGDYVKYEPEKHASLHVAANAAFQTLVDLVTACQQSRLIKEGDPVAWSIVTWSTLHGFSVLLVHKRLKFVDDDPESLAAMSELVARSSLETIRRKR
ncbi:MAG: TetR/AcrR family transcriptional regulator [Betaproteobacteria bacterium]